MHEYPLAWTRNGEPFEPPVNAVAWRARRVGQDWDEYDMVTVRNPRLGCYVPLVFHLRATPTDLREAVEGQSGLYCLDPIDELGRVLAWTPAYVAVPDEDRRYSVDPGANNYDRAYFSRCNYKPAST